MRRNGVLVRLFAVLALLVGTAGAAFAHAQLVASDPADGSIVSQAPKAFTLTFDEPVSPITLKLARPDGTVTLLETVTVDGAALTIAAPPGIDNGSYALSYRVISADGHPIGGAALFSIGAPGGSGKAPAADATPPASRLLILVQRTVLYLGVVFGVGGAFASHWLGASRRDGAGAMRALLLAGMAAALAGFGLQGLDMLAVSPEALALATPWRMGLGTTYGWTLAGALAALLLSLASLQAGRTAGKALSLAALVITGLAFALSGHASAADPQQLTRPAVFLHVVAMVFWGGALMPLTLALRRGGIEAGEMLRRFSLAIVPMVIALVASGAALAVNQLHGSSALWTTDYGIVFLVKLALLAPLFLAAAINRLLLTKPALSGGASPSRSSSPARAKLRLSIAIEVVLVAAILATVSNWRFTVPPRALALAAARPVAVDLVSDKALAEVTIFPDTAGPVTVSIMPMSNGSGDLTVKEMSVIFSNPAAGIEAIRRPATMSEDGDYVVQGVSLPMPGQWHIRVEILISDFEMTAPEGDVTIRP